MKLIAVILGTITIGMGQLMSVDLTSRSTAVQQLPADGRMSSDFGFRRRPCRGGSHYHPGVDIANVRATPIEATGAGTIVSVSRDRGYGLMVEIDHGRGWTTRYAHLSGVDVKEGDQVRAGDLVGKMGRTGRATGTHLHYELRRYGLAVNPAPYLAAAQSMVAINN